MSADQTLIQVTDHIYYLNSLALSSRKLPAVSGIYIITGEEIILIESSIIRLAHIALQAIESLGYPRKAITKLILTHIHLDHAGAAGWLVQQLPWLKVYVHEKGAKHLIKPERLLQSATEVYGSMEEVRNIHGEFVALPEENVIPVSDLVISGNRGSSLRFFSTPGHAPHHLSIYDEESNGVFSGEAAGHYIPQTGILYPAVAPPSFSLHDSFYTLDIIEKLHCSYIFFSQFGAAKNPGKIIHTARQQLLLFHELIQKMISEGKNQDDMLCSLMDNLGMSKVKTDTDLRTRNTFFSTLWGYLQYMQKNRL